MANKEVDVSDMCLSKGATVHGAFVGPISPIRRSRSSTHSKEIQYFDTFFSDGIKTVRVVSFDPKLKPKVDNAREKGEEVALTNCCVQKRKDCDEMEIVIGNRSNLIKSPKRFRLDNLLTTPNTHDIAVDIGTLVELTILPISQHVNVKGKVISIESPVIVNSARAGQLKKQDVILADSTAVYRCVVWETNVGKLEVGTCYELKDIVIKSYDGTEYLSLSEHSTIVVIEDIGDVVENTLSCSSTNDFEIKGEITGVATCDTYSSCRSCKGKTKEITQVIVECTKCGVKAKADRCKQVTTARLLIEDTEGKEYKVTVFNEVIEAIVSNVGADTTEKLLSAPPMKFAISSKDIVTSVVLM